jgi:hypothetical protein
MQPNEYTLIAETPSMYQKRSMAAFIKQEVQRPSKQWIKHVLEGTQERDKVVIKTAEFLLLPDTESIGRYNKRAYTTKRKLESNQTTQSLKWLSIVQDSNIRTLRDLRGHHVPMLKRMMEVCLCSIEKEIGIPQDQVMAYIHYPPSVYQLHVHFCFPYVQYYHRDSDRVHNLKTVIENLELAPDYYERVTLYMAIPRKSMHCSALHAPEDSEAKPEPLEEQQDTGQDIKGATPFVKTSYPRISPPKCHVPLWSHSRVWSTLETNQEAPTHSATPAHQA